MARIFGVSVCNWAETFDRTNTGVPKGYGYGTKSFVPSNSEKMFSKTAERLMEFCMETIGDDLRAVIEYNDEGIQSTYFRDDVELAVEDLSMNILHNPILTFQRSGWRLTEMFEHFGPPTASIQAYGDKLMFTIPIDRREGVFMSVDRKESYISELFEELEALVHETERGER